MVSAGRLIFLIEYNLKKGLTIFQRFHLGLIIFTIARYRRLKTITNIFLASLASADLLLVIICVPVNVSRKITNSYLE